MISALKEGYVWVIHTSSKRVCINTQKWRGQNGMKVMNIINLALVKRDLLRHEPEMKAGRGMGQGLSDHHVLCKVRLVGAWIKRREVVDGARRIRSERLMEHQYMERCLLKVRE